MPSYPSHWAGISGSIEVNETPLDAAKRELTEETNLRTNDLSFQPGLYVDVHRPNKKSIRVYPFLVQLTNDDDEVKLELRGTEHDAHRFVSVSELEELRPTVPKLALAFHHASRGKYLTLDESVREWESDLENGAAELARRAVLLHPQHPMQVAVLRPTMVPIVNVMNELDEGGNDPQGILDDLGIEARRAVDLGIEAIRDLSRRKNQTLVVATLSRSGTIFSVLKCLKEDGTCHDVKISKSVPGNEGEIMARDLNCSAVDDQDLLDCIRNGEVDLLLFGADCVMTSGVVNKIGTKVLAQAAKEQGRTEVFCCADRWKLWEDVFPPPMEDIFEFVPIDLIDRLLVPDERNACESNL